MAKLIDLKHQVSRFKSYLRDMQFLPIWVIALNVLPDFIMSNMQTFLTESVGFSLTIAAVIVNAHDGFSGMFAIIGSWVGDVYLTRYGIIIISSLSYLSGLVLLTFVSVRQNDRLNDKPVGVIDENGDIIISRWLAWLVGVGLLLVSMGNFSLTNSAHALSVGGDRITSHQNLIKYALKFIVLVVSFLKTDWYIPEYDNNENLLHTPPQQFLYPAVSMLLITIVSLCYLKNNSFRKPTEDRSTLLNYVPRAYITATKQYLLKRPNDTLSLIDNRFLEMSEITESPGPVLGRPKSRLAITQVKGGKQLLRMVSMCLAFLAYGLVKSIGDTFFLDQTYKMDSNDEVPIQAFIYLATFSSSIAIYLYKVTIFNRLPQPGKKYSPAIEYAMGMVLSTLCCTTASWVAMSGFQHMEKNDEISVFRLTPQFVFFGAMDGLAGEGIEQFFSEQLPPTMRSYANVFTQGIIGAGSIFAIILILVTNAASNWLNDEDNLRLDKFYHLLTVVGIGIFFGYTLVAVKYRYQDIEEENQEEGQSQLEDGNEPKHVQNTLISH